MALITLFDPWKSKLCSCPPKYSLSAYTGCGHGCLYCYASSYIRDFHQPRPKKDFLKRLEKEIEKIPAGAIIALANSSDPYQPLEEKLKLTQKALVILSSYDLKINLVTKSSLILRDLEILKKIKKILVSISLTTLDKKLAKILEPQSPMPQERLKAIKVLSAYLPVVVRLDPLIYPLTTQDLEKTIKTIKACGAQQLIISTYKTKPDNFKRMTAGFKKLKLLWKKLYLERGEKKSGYLYLPLSLRQEIIKKVRAIALSYNLNFSSCREGVSELNSSACDGSDFYFTGINDGIVNGAITDKA